MRLDVSVNMFTWQALRNNEMTIYGGDQVRPNIHIKDMVNVYKHFLENPQLDSGCYNAGFENISKNPTNPFLRRSLDIRISRLRDYTRFPGGATPGDICIL